MNIPPKKPDQEMKYIINWCVSLLCVIFGLYCFLKIRMYRIWNNLEQHEVNYELKEKSLKKIMLNKGNQGTYM